MNDLFSNLTKIRNERPRAINGENLTGKPGAGGMAESRLGVGRKGNPCVKICPYQTTILMDYHGTGIIKHIWMTVTDETENEYFVLSNLILRMYWDDEDNPSVEVPLGDFFLNNFGEKYVVNSLPMQVNPHGGMNCYFEMPFKSAAKIEIVSEHSELIPHFFYQIDFVEVDELPEDTLYFHAQYRKEPITVKKQDYVVLDGVKGKGHYVGMNLSIIALERYWWGEGEVKFYLDGDKVFPTICGTGLEDYFLGSWAFTNPKQTPKIEQTYQNAFSGYPYFTNVEKTMPQSFDCRALPKRAFYRFHITDPISFKQEIKITIQQIGLSNYDLFERSDDYSSVAYWYQTEPHNIFPKLPSKDVRRPR